MFAFERLLEHSFTKELRMDPKDHPLILLEPPIITPLQNREEMAEICFEKLQVPHLLFQDSATAILKAYGKTTGLVVDSGETMTSIVPVIEGDVVPFAAQFSTSLSGKNITNYLVQLMNDKGYEFNTAAERAIVEDMKQKCCHVSLDYAAETKETIEKSISTCYEVGHSGYYYLDQERFKCTEALFSPCEHIAQYSVLDTPLEVSVAIGNKSNAKKKFQQFEGLNEEENQIIIKSNNHTGMQNLVYHAIQKIGAIKNTIESSQSIQRTLLGNICLAGGNAQFNGIKERLEKEVNNDKIYPSNVTAAVHKRSDAKYCAFTGACLIAGEENFKDKLISKQMYEEMGKITLHY